MAEAQLADPGIPMDDLPRLVRGGSPQTETYEERIGRGVLNRLLEQVVQGGVAAGGDPVAAVRDTLGIAKDLAGVEDSRTKRLLDELRETRTELDRLRREMDRTSRAGGDSNLELFKFLMQMMDKAQERTEKILAEMRADQKEWRDREGRGNKATADEFFVDMGRQYLSQQLQRDPIAEYERLDQHFAERHTRANPDNVIEFERWKKQKEFELEERRDQREEARAEREESRRAQMLTDLGKLVVTVQQGRGQGTGLPAAAPADPAAAAAQAGLYRYACGSCGKEIILTERAEQLVCPYCHTSLTTNLGMGDDAAG